MEPLQEIEAKPKQYKLYIAKKHDNGARGAGWPATKSFNSDEEAIIEFTAYVKEQFLPTAHEVECSIYEGENKRIVNTFMLHNPNPYPLGYKPI
jgi:hypothetical protein